jgi:methyltransferase (TIGR00027 family)
LAETPIGNVSDTAFWIAHYRALETQRPDALFRDPLAGVLAGDRGRDIARAMPRSFMTAWAVVIRTCIIDDYIRWALAQGVDAVLNLGAGLDTRPYRMDLPKSLLWVEADYPQTIELKELRLASEQPRCRLERVKLDLANVPERRAMFSNVNARAAKVLVLTEGVVPYLTNDHVASLADDLTALHRAGYWILDYFDPELFKYRRRALRNKLQNAPFQFNPQDWFGFFAAHGWRLKEIRYLTEEGKRLQRPAQLGPLLRLLLTIRKTFASNKKRQAFRRAAGYVLMERQVA